MKFGKRGVSPLIATILLIAFAVALGAVVMNIGRALRPSGPMEVGCGVYVGLEIIKVGGQERVCVSGSGANSKVELTVRNGPNVDIEDFRVSIVGARDVYNIEKVLTEKISKAAAKKLILSYDSVEYGKIEQVVVVPQIKQSGELVLCTNGQLVLENLKPC